MLNDISDRTQTFEGATENGGRAIRTTLLIPNCRKEGRYFPRRIAQEQAVCPESRALHRDLCTYG